MGLEVYVGGKPLRVPDDPFASGGEAAVYKINPSTVLKYFKPPGHPEFQFPNLDERKAADAIAQARIDEHQHKLKKFPKNLPPHVVAPAELATDKQGRIVGYTMPFIEGGVPIAKLMRKAARKTVPVAAMREVLLRLHRTVSAVHAAGVVIGDFNEDNILVAGKEPYLIDADSMQFGPYGCRTYFAMYIDPALCDPDGKTPVPVRPRSADSDWYAFTVLVMKCLLFVGPYDGVYTHPPGKPDVPDLRRPLVRLTLFRPEVACPKMAVPYKVLPDELLAYFKDVFEKDRRGLFPIDLLENLRWTVCAGCKIEHGRPACPDCKTAAPAPAVPKRTTTVRGKVTATRVFETAGVIIHAQYVGGRLLWLTHETGADGKGRFFREQRVPLMSGDLDPRVRWRLQADATCLGSDCRLVIVKAGTDTRPRLIDQANHRPIFDTNAGHVYWTAEEQLFRDDPRFDQVALGKVVGGRTHIWAGPAFGFGYYRAGTMLTAFVFDAERPGINDSPSLPPIRGKLVDAHAVLAAKRAWLFTSSQENGVTTNRCHVIARDGTVQGVAEARAGSGHWLTQTRGGTAYGSFLLMPTDDGIVCIEPDGNGGLAVKNTYPDTEPFVETGSRLFFDNGSVYVVGESEILKIAIAP